MLRRLHSCAPSHFSQPACELSVMFKGTPGLVFRGVEEEDMFGFTIDMVDKMTTKMAFDADMRNAHANTDDAMISSVFGRMLCVQRLRRLLSLAIAASGIKRLVGLPVADSRQTVRAAEVVAKAKCCAHAISAEFISTINAMAEDKTKPSFSFSAHINVTGRRTDVTASAVLSLPHHNEKESNFRCEITLVPTSGATCRATPARAEFTVSIAKAQGPSFQSQIAAKIEAAKHRRVVAGDLCVFDSHELEGGWEHVMDC
jgi:hypothetical protein